MAANYTDANGDLMIWTGTGYHRIPSIQGSDWGERSAMRWDPNLTFGDQQGGWVPENRYGFADSADGALYNEMMAKYGFPADQKNMYFFGDKDKIGATLKSGDKVGTQIEWTRDPTTGNFVPKLNGQQSWNTNEAENNWAGFLAAAGLLGAGAGAAGAFGAAGAPAAGGAGGAVGGEAAVNPYALTAADFAPTSAPASAWGSTGAGYVPGSYAASPFSGAVAGEGGAATFGGTLGGMAPGATAPVSGGGGGGGLSGSGIKWPTTMGEWGDWLTKIGGVASSAGGGGSSGQSGLGAGIGGLLGGLAGYLDAKNQPNELTVQQKIDPALHDIIYGVNNSGGYAQDAYNLLKSQNGQPNPLVDAGKQISGMAGQLPAWSTLVDQSKSQWDANPWIGQQQKAITDLTTRNLMENVLPNVNSGAMAAGGYGGSRQGIAQAKSISDMNTNLAPALADLASNAWNSSQNRALAGAGAAGNYGLSNQQQQAGLLSTGATLQANGPWNSYKQFGGILSNLPGNQSNVQPLFTNVWGNTLGGAQLGSQVGGSTNWDEILKSIGGIAGGIGSLFGGK